MGQPGLAFKWGTPDWVPQIVTHMGVNQMKFKMEVPHIGSWMGHPILVPRWGTPDWFPEGVPCIGSQIGSPTGSKMGHPRIVPRWGAQD